MAFKVPGKAPVEQEVAIHPIRIPLTSRHVKSLEKVGADLFFQMCKTGPVIMQDFLVACFELAQERRE